MTEEKNQENQENLENAGTVATRQKKSHGALFGSLLLWFLVLTIIGILAGIAWGGYRGWNMREERAALPSISTLSETDTTAKNEPAPEAIIEAEVAAPAPETSVEDTKKAKATEIKVLNGGAAKGSAGTATTFLTREGYTKVTLGNTLSDYAGTTVYFAVGLDKEAAILKTTLLPNYPKTEVKPALPNNKETTAAPLTVILGK